MIFDIKIACGGERIPVRRKGRGLDILGQRSVVALYT